MMSTLNTALLALVAMSSLTTAIPLNNISHHHKIHPTGLPRISTPPALNGSFSLTHTPPPYPFTPALFPTAGIPVNNNNNNNSPDKRHVHLSKRPHFTPLPTPSTFPTPPSFPTPPAAGFGDAGSDKSSDEAHKQHHPHSGFPSLSGVLPTFAPVPTGGLPVGQLVEF